MNSTNPANSKTYHVLDNANQVTTDPCQHADYDVINSQNCDLNHSNFNSTQGGGAMNHENHSEVNPQQIGQRDSELNQMQSVESNTGTNHQNQQSFQHCVKMNPQQSTDLAMNQQSCSQDQQVFHEMLPPVRRDPTICASTVNIVTVNHQNDQGRNQQSIRLNSDMNPHSFILPDRQPGLSSYYRHQRPVNKVQPPTCEDVAQPGQVEDGIMATNYHYTGQQKCASKQHINKGQVVSQHQGVNMATNSQGQQHFNNAQIKGQQHQINNAQHSTGRSDYQHPRPPHVQNNSSMQVSPMQNASFQNQYSRQDAYHQYDSQFSRPVPTVQNHHAYHGNIHPQFQHQHHQLAHPQQVHNCQRDYQQQPPQNQYQCYPVQGNNMPTAGYHNGQCNAVQPVKHETNNQTNKSAKEEKSLSASKIDDPKARKKRLTMSQDQLQQLKNFFYNETAYPCFEQVYDLLEKTKLTEKELRCWFKNRRKRDRKKGIEIKKD